MPETLLSQRETDHERKEVTDETGKSKFVEFPEGHHSMFTHNHFQSVDGSR